MSNPRLLHGTRTDRTKPTTLPTTPWDSLSGQILTTLRGCNAMTTSEIAQSVGENPRKVQDVLIQLDDQEKVNMRNGWYSLSAAERTKQG